MPNSETIHLSLTPREADSVAYVLMTTLHSPEVTMLSRERTDVTDTANALFKQLGYGHATNERGQRVEASRRTT